MNGCAETIACALGLHRAGREFTGKCPSCGYASGFSVTERNGVLLYHCHAGGCSQSDVRGALQRAGLAPEKSEPAAVEKRRPSTRRQRASQIRGLSHSVTALPTANSNREQAVLAIWRRSQPGAGTTVEIYLRTVRGYTGPIPPTLRFAEGTHPSNPEHYYPMMVAAVIRDNRIAAIHRTFVRADGTGKADLDPNKMTLGPCKGAAVPLAPAGPLLAVAEGIETALSFMQATGIATWAALSASGIRNLILPPLVRDVVIAADNDPTGLAAAYAAAGRWTAYGRKVRVVVPPTGRGDFNDMARAMP
jgi:putative DNA primase/helicase